MGKIAVLTPTFNRRVLIERLYHSLEQQSDADFVWIVVDDGSTDETEAYFASLEQAGCPFELRYQKKENGGKSSALNYAFVNNPDILFFAIIDSDDSALPDAVRTIKRKVEEYAEEREVGAIWFRYNNPDGSQLKSNRGNSHTEAVVMTRYEHDAVYSKDDGCIGYFDRAVREYRFPEYEGEKYVGPIVLQMEMAEKYKIAFTVDTVGTAEYQEGGLSKSGRKLRLKNPLGMIHYCGLLQSKKNRSFRSRLLYTVGGQAYLILSPYSKKEAVEKGIRKEWLKWWAKPFGWILAVKWSRK